MREQLGVEAGRDYAKDWLKSIVGEVVLAQRAATPEEAGGAEEARATEEACSEPLQTFGGPPDAMLPALPDARVGERAAAAVAEAAAAEAAAAEAAAAETTAAKAAVAEAAAAEAAAAQAAAVEAAAAVAAAAEAAAAEATAAEAAAAQAAAAKAAAAEAAAAEAAAVEAAAAEAAATEAAAAEAGGGMHAGAHLCDEEIGEDDLFGSDEDEDEAAEDAAVAGEPAEAVGVAKAAEEMEGRAVEQAAVAAPAEEEAEDEGEEEVEGGEAVRVEPEPAEPSELESKLGNELEIEIARQSPPRLSPVPSHGGGGGSRNAPSTAVRTPAALRPAHPRRRLEAAPACTAQSDADAGARTCGAHEAAEEEQGQEQGQEQEQEQMQGGQEAPPHGWAWPEEGTVIEVEVEQEGRVCWVPARVCPGTWRTDGSFQAAIRGAEPFKDWFSWDQEGPDWRRVPGTKSFVVTPASPGGAAAPHSQSKRAPRAQSKTAPRPQSKGAPRPQSKGTPRAGQVASRAAAVSVVDRRPLNAANAVGRLVLIPAEMWPDFACDENGGVGCSTPV